MDLVHYEARVMQVGAWQTFEELEEQLTIDELFAIYNELTSKEIRTAQAALNAMGGQANIEYGPPTPTKKNDDGGDVLKDLFGRVSEKLGREIETDDTVKKFRSMKIGYNRNQ